MEQNKYFSNMKSSFNNSLIPSNTWKFKSEKYIEKLGINNLWTITHYQYNICSWSKTFKCFNLAPKFEPILKCTINLDGKNNYLKNIVTNDVL